MSSSLKGIQGNPLHFTKRTDNYPQHEVKALRAALKELKQRLLALEVKFNKFDSFSHEPREDNKRKKRARKECDYCKKTGKWAQGHDESECLHKQRDGADAKLQAIKERRAGKSRQGTTSEKKSFGAGAIGELLSRLTCARGAAITTRWRCEWLRRQAAADTGQRQVIIRFVN